MEVKIKLLSKRLNSGRCQVHFHVKPKAGGVGKWYGYTLAEPEDTLSEVVNRIKNRFNEAEDRLYLHQKVLYNINGFCREQDDLMIFNEA
jgi:hypothetical protein